MQKIFAAIDYTNWEHAGYAVAMQLGILLFFGRRNFDRGLVAGTVAGIVFFLGREHAQAEKRLMAKGIKDAVWPAFDLRLWDWNSRFDLLFPIVACSLVALLLVFCRRRLSNSPKRRS